MVFFSLSLTFNKLSLLLLMLQTNNQTVPLASLYGRVFCVKLRSWCDGVAEVRLSGGSSKWSFVYVEVCLQ